MKAPGKSIKLAPPKEDEPTLDVTGKGAAPDSSVKPIQIKVPVSKHTKTSLQKKFWKFTLSIWGKILLNQI